MTGNQSVFSHKGARVDSMRLRSTVGGHDWPLERGASPAAKSLSHCYGAVAWAIEADAFERFVDLFERLFAEVRDAEKVFPFAVEQVIYREYAALFEAIRGANGEADFSTAHLQLLSQVDRVLVSAVQWDTCHLGLPPVVIGCVIGAGDYCGNRLASVTVSAKVYQVSNGARMNLHKKRLNHRAMLAWGLRSNQHLNTDRRQTFMAGVYART
jgi:hypothetical protein